MGPDFQAIVARAYAVAVKSGKADPDVDIWNHPYDPLEDPDPEDSDESGRDLFQFGGDVYISESEDPDDPRTVEIEIGSEYSDDDVTVQLHDNEDAEPDVVLDDEEEKANPPNSNNSANLNPSDADADADADADDEKEEGPDADDDSDDNSDEEEEGPEKDEESDDEKVFVFHKFKGRGPPQSTRQQLDHNVRGRFDTFANHMQELQDATRDISGYSFGGFCFTEQNPNLGKDSGKRLLTPEFHFWADGPKTASGLENSSFRLDDDDCTTIVSPDLESFKETLFKKTRF